jgi:hypothetical protein
MKHPLHKVCAGGVFYVPEKSDLRTAGIGFWTGIIGWLLVPVGICPQLLGDHSGRRRNFLFAEKIVA